MVGLGMKLTYGLELEWADVDRWAALPVGSWSRTDNSIVNSDGHANDPKGIGWQWGGEINTTPTDTIAGQVAQVVELAELLHPVINYRCNLHVHVGLGAPPTLTQAQVLLGHIDRWQNDLYPLVDPIPQPDAADYATTEEHKGARARYFHSLGSHQRRLPASFVAEAMQAQTLQGFFDAHFGLSATGARNERSPRAGMNTKSLLKHETLEFRHFAGSANPHHIGEALRWCDLFVTSAFNGENPVELFHTLGPWGFPKHMKYEHHLETEWRLTKKRGL